MRKLDKKFVNKHKHQEIIITGSHAVKILEDIGLILHIAAFILGLLTISGMVGHAGDKYKHVVELATLIVVALILIQFALTPIIERMVLKRLLKDFWGTTDIATSMSYPLEVDPFKNFGSVVKSEDSLQLETTRLGWTTVKLFPFKRVLTIQQSTPVTTKRWSRYAASDGTFNFGLIPIYIIIDVSQSVIKFQGRANILFSRQKDLPEKRILFTFYYKDKKAEWSGIAPEHPLYGEWIWDTQLAEEIKKGSEGKRNQALMNNQAVAEAFERRRSIAEENEYTKHVDDKRH